MVQVGFYQNGDAILTVTLKSGSAPDFDGDASWLDLEFKPTSTRLGHPVGLEEDPEEWGRALVASYDENQTVEARLITDTGSTEEAGKPAIWSDNRPETSETSQKRGLLEKVLAFAVGAGASVLLVVLLVSLRPEPAPPSLKKRSADEQVEWVNVSNQRDWLGPWLAEYYNRQKGWGSAQFASDLQRFATEHNLSIAEQGGWRIVVAKPRQLRLEYRGRLVRAMFYAGYKDLMVRYFAAPIECPLPDPSAKAKAVAARRVNGAPCPTLASYRTS